MGQRLTADEGVTALYDSTSGWAFGPVFSSADDMKDFLHFASEHRGYTDLRGLADEVIEDLHNEYLHRRERNNDEPLYHKDALA